MFQLPDQLVAAYRMYFGRKGRNGELLSDYLKWLRFFLDFCAKYNIDGDDPDRLRQFIGKLKEKGQSEDQRRQAYHAVSLYFALLNEHSSGSHTNDTRNDSAGPVAEHMPQSAPATSVQAARRSYLAGRLRHPRYQDTARSWQSCPDKQNKCDNEVYFAEKRRYASIALKTTMIYTHCVPVRRIKEPKSPLDF